MTGLLRRWPRSAAALAFGTAGLLLPAAWFLPAIVRNQDRVAVALYVGLPGLAAALAGAALGRRLLDPVRVRGPGAAALRGAAVASAALVLFAPLFATLFIWTAPGRTNMLGLTALVLVFSIVAVWWAVAIVGAAVGWLLHRLATQAPGATA